MRYLIETEVSTAMDSPYGINLVGHDALFKIFIEPFKDVLDTTKGEIEKTSANIRLALEVAFKAAITTLIPIISEDYDEVFEEHSAELQEIQGRYSAVYKRNIDAFKNPDVLGTAFVIFPAAVITRSFIEKSPVAALSLMKMLGGRKVGGVLDKVGKKFNIKTESVSKNGNLILEKNKKRRDSLEDVLLDPRLLKAVSQGELAQEMSSDGTELFKKTLTELIKKSLKLLRAKSVEEFASLLEKNIPELDRLKQVPEEERRHLEPFFLKQLKDATKKIYTLSLKADMKKMVDAGISENHPATKMYKMAIDKISGIS